MLDADVLVIGAGAVGASTALHLARAGHRVIVLEKEPGPALHQSGRNSGVIHAGYNLKPGSLKARFCVEGNRRLKEYCRARGVAVREGGILVVARTEGERPVLAELERRGRANGTGVRLLAPDAFREIEPHAVGVEALHALDGASFDARAYVHALTGDALLAGARILYDTRVLALDATGERARVTTTSGTLEARVVVNCAGLHADRLAGELAPDVRVIPFRGYYAELVPRATDLVKSHIYAAPDLRFPFVGVHLSHRADGRVIVGPGAMLAFGREAYRFWGVNLRDLASTLGWPGFWKLWLKPHFRRLLPAEVNKSLSLGAIAAEARRLVPDLARADLVRSYAGVRAQLVDRKGELVEDVLVRETERAVHVLNAVSPGLTASLPFGEHLAGLAAKKL